MDDPAAASGELVQAGLCYRAFVPARLPPAFEIDASLQARIAAAEVALRELAARIARAADPDAFVEARLRREATASARLDEGDDVAPTVADAIERTTRDGIERLQRLPLSLRLLCELHAGLMRDRPGAGGEFRRHQTWVGPPGSAPATADYVPAPPGKLPELLDDWQRYLHADDGTHDLVRLAILDAQFRHLQPFAQAGGCLGRIWISLYLIDRGWLPAPVLLLSEVMARDPSVADMRLRGIREASDWSGWIGGFADGLAAAARQD